MDVESEHMGSYPFLSKASTEGKGWLIQDYLKCDAWQFLSPYIAQIKWEELELGNKGERTKEIDPRVTSYESK